MAAKDNTAARGTIALVLSRGGYFVLGYLAVVVLARELGPAAYGIYSVIMALLVWLEESGRYAVPSAAAKLLAETSEPSEHQAFERSALALNLSVHIFFMLALWALAPWLASWFDIEDGALLFRLAAIDLPLFGLYTAIQAIHQGHRHFMRLGVSQVAYAFAKFAGVLSLMAIGVSLQKALIINVLSTIVGCAFLFSKSGLRWQGAWFSKVSPLVAIAVPIGLYYFPLMLRSTLLLGALRLLLPDSEEATIGILMAAVNIARVPAFALATVTVVILPSISSALSRDDMALAQQYLQQALRFFAILFLPACFVLVVESETLKWAFPIEADHKRVLFDPRAAVLLNGFPIRRLCRPHIGECKRHQMVQAVQFPNVLDIADHGRITVVDHGAVLLWPSNATGIVAVPIDGRTARWRLRAQPLTKYLDAMLQPAVGLCDMGELNLWANVPRLPIDTRYLDRLPLVCWLVPRTLRQAPTRGVNRAMTPDIEQARSDFLAFHASQSIYQPFQPSY